MSIAQDMYDGDCCTWCNVYFTKKHGFPVACDRCWKEAIEEFGSEEEVIKETGVQKHNHPELSPEDEIE